MKRGAATTDRLIVLVIGLTLVAAGAALVAWQWDRLPFTFDAVDLGGLVDARDQPWWPWALGAGSALVALLGLLLLARQFPARGPRTFVMSTDGSAGSVTLDASALTARAAHLAADVDGVRSARARLAIEGLAGRPEAGRGVAGRPEAGRGMAVRGRQWPVLTVAASLDRTADPVAAIEALGQVRAGVADVVGDSVPLAVRITVSVR